MHLLDTRVQEVVYTNGILPYQSCDMSTKDTRLNSVAKIGNYFHSEKRISQSLLRSIATTGYTYMSYNHEDGKDPLTKEISCKDLVDLNS